MGETVDDVAASKKLRGICKPSQEAGTGQFQIQIMKNQTNQENK